VRIFVSIEPLIYTAAFAVLKSLASKALVLLMYVTVKEDSQRKQFG
jgi:hypothetical protein